MEKEQANDAHALTCKRLQGMNWPRRMNSEAAHAQESGVTAVETLFRGSAALLAHDVTKVDRAQTVVVYRYLCKDIFFHSSRPSSVPRLFAFLDSFPFSFAPWAFSPRGLLTPIESATNGFLRNDRRPNTGRPKAPSDLLRPC